MRRSPFVITLGAALLAGASCKNVSHSVNPPPEVFEPPPAPEVVPEPLTGNPPPPNLTDGPVLPGMDPAPATDGLPTWDESLSGHPEGATNPPIPSLAVTAEGQCFKEWSDPRMVENMDGRVLQDASEARGEEIQCPSEATALIERARRGKMAQEAAPEVEE